jgi:hypothetical protein
MYKLISWLRLNWGYSLSDYSVCFKQRQSEIHQHYEVSRSLSSQYFVICCRIYRNATCSQVTFSLTFKVLIYVYLYYVCL